MIGIGQQNTLVSEFVQAFSERAGFRDLEWSARTLDASILVLIRLAAPTERHFAIIEDLLSEERFRDNLEATFETKLPQNVLQSSETRALQTLIAESANVNRYTFGDNFFSRYVPSVSGAEDLITANSHHIVFGRRGAGKTSLLLFGLHSRVKSSEANVWVDMQTFEQRLDSKLLPDVLISILEQLSALDPNVTAVADRLAVLRNSRHITEDSVRQILPDVRRGLESISKQRPLFVFLDDFHLVGRRAQAELLSGLYAVARGNRVFVKVSAIESLTQTWDSNRRIGMKIPDDLRAIPLDLNLTVPERATAHIKSILDSRSTYCALPSVATLCTNEDVLTRLVWVSAGVPRDALTTFGQAISKAIVSDSKKVAVTSVNIAASENVNNKLADAKEDSDDHELEPLIDEIKYFCLVKERKNAFLVEIARNTTYSRIKELIDLRVLHVISESITTGDTAKKFVALMLDYGYYIGARKARNFELFNAESRKIRRADLRKLPVFRSANLAVANAAV